MNANNRRRFAALPTCRCCGMEPMRVYCDAADRYAVKCDCGNRTAGFTTIAGASHSWNHIMKMREGGPSAVHSQRILRQRQPCNVGNH